METYVAWGKNEEIETPGDFVDVLYIKLSDTDRETQVKRELHFAEIEFNPYA